MVLRFRKRKKNNLLVYCYIDHFLELGIPGIPISLLVLLFPMKKKICREKEIKQIQNSIEIRFQQNKKEIHEIINCSKSRDTSTFLKTHKY